MYEVTMYDSPPRLDIAQCNPWTESDLSRSTMLLEQLDYVFMMVSPGQTKR